MMGRWIALALLAATCNLRSHAAKKPSTKLGSGCNDDPFNDPDADYFCASKVWWPVTSQTAADVVSIDARARSIYNEAKERHYSGGLSLECLAVLKLNICASLFNRCLSDNSIGYTCNYVCDFYWKRCPHDIEGVCLHTTSDKDDCAFATSNSGAFAIFTAIFMILLL
eukprot:TRINITY_DN6240_c0_g1_i1.p1 TRINITY_DN6240_c0_g1~~TRINITY_DN6240_c0_g1_i1.p1  ORF type:complete len:168 (+),score=9.11 TRINITY_DN6240_c0_g1_i1:143-646(+)